MKLQLHLYSSPTSFFKFESEFPVRTLILIKLRSISFAYSEIFWPYSILSSSNSLSDPFDSCDFLGFYLSSSKSLGSKENFLDLGDFDSTTC